MGEELYREIADTEAAAGRPCRVYAPVGSHEDLLPYLVRRLLENGANTSFVNRIVHAELPADDVVEDPVDATTALGGAVRHPRIPRPAELFGESRRNSAGLNLAHDTTLAGLRDELARAEDAPWRAAPIVAGRVLDGAPQRRANPADRDQTVGTVVDASAAAAREAVGVAAAFQPQWDALGARQRATMLRGAADLFERHRAELVARCVREAGRTVADSLAELREAVDFLRYYAAEAERLIGEPRRLPGVTGETNELRLRGRGVFVCVSPWNFPLSIFVGQIAAALAAGNTVLAKPAEQSPLVAYRAVELMLEAGVPPGALQLLPGDGPSLGAAMLGDARVAGVVFTGSTETAAAINARLAERRGPLATLIAETGGINAMLVDSSALPEQVVKDAVQSAFNSAGQRCSALRLLCLQEDTAERILTMLEGCIRELVIGDPGLLSTDVGPVIDADARAMLADYVAGRAGRVRFQCGLRAELARGLYFPPTLIELDRARDLTREVFGPVLHVVRYGAGRELELIEELNGLGYGLTLGVHSRIESFATAIAAHARVGNVYVNRNIIGAQVGCQPFGGMGLSGTGPKAGGPHYLERFTVEQVVTTNTAAVGGNASLFGALP
jgi:RHH-type proline utilization regulon transcriptional repressor/proline dehydrogenase/delta 1-pyrroline-5-carboxylate dehydrogenase